MRKADVAGIEASLANNPGIATQKFDYDLTLLHLAAGNYANVKDEETRANLLAIAERFIAKGADINALTTTGKSPLDMLEGKKDSPMGKLLRPTEPEQQTESPTSLLNGATTLSRPGLSPA